MAQQLSLKVKGSEALINRFIKALEEKYLVIPTSQVKHPLGEDPFIYITVVETPR
jgi:Tfp pilus assembly protein PilZ